MKIILFVGVTLFSLVGMASSLTIGKCKAILDGTEVKLEFSKDSDSAEQINGSYKQSMAGQTFRGKAHLEKVDKGWNVTMYSILEGDHLFATFVLPDGPASTVTIYAPAYGANWGTFSCSARQ